MKIKWKVNNDRKVYSSFTYMSKCVRHEIRGAILQYGTICEYVQEIVGCFGTHMYTYEWVGTWIIY